MENTTQAVQRLKGEALALATLIDYADLSNPADARQVKAHAEVLRMTVGAVNAAQDREAFGSNLKGA